MKKYIRSSANGNIPYQLVSMAAILRDFTEPKYKNAEQEKLTDIADSLYNVGESVVKNFKDDYKALYDAYGKAYFDKVLKDMSAIDGQLTSEAKEQELYDDYMDRIGSSAIQSSKKINATRWYYKEPMTEAELASLKKDILALPGCDKLDMDTRDMEEIGYIMLLPGYEGIELSDPQYYAKRKQLLKDILRVAKEHGLTRTEDSIEDYGSCWYIVFDTNKPKTDRYDEF